MHESLYWALAANIVFAASSASFAEFSRVLSPMFVNLYKALWALIAFSLFCALAVSWTPVASSSALAFIISGAVGLMIGDYFMLRSMAELGAARMLMIFGIEPFLLALGGYLLLQQKMYTSQFLGVVSMIVCLFLFSLEKFKATGHWSAKGILFGVIAIILDASGLLLTRYAFDQTAGLHVAQANLIRCMGALIAFIFSHFFFQRISIAKELRTLSRKDQVKVTVASISGTFISLFLYLTAVSKGNLAQVSSIAVTGPLFAAIYEHVRDRRWPTVHFVTALLFFLCGFYLLASG